MQIAHWLPWEAALRMGCLVPPRTRTGPGPMGLQPPQGWEVTHPISVLAWALVCEGRAGDWVAADLSWLHLPSLCLLQVQCLLSEHSLWDRPWQVEGHWGPGPQTDPPAGGCWFEKGLSACGNYQCLLAPQCWQPGSWTPVST